MANVSSSNGLEKRPRLSFQQADGSYFPNWTSASLGSIILPYSEKVYGEHSYEVLTSSREGLQRQSDHFATEQRHDTDGYNVIPFGYCTYRNRSDDGKFTFNMNKISENGIVSKFYPVFSFENANSEFMIEYLNSSENIKKKLSVLAVGTSQVVLSFEALKKAQFPIPCKAEQDRIAALLECINRRIVAQSKIVDSLKKYKRGLLTYAFEEMTLSDDADSTTYHFSEIAQRRKEKYSPDSGVEYPCIELEHIEQGTGRLLGSVSSTTQSSIKTVARSGDVLFGKLRPYLRKFAFAEQNIVCSSEIWAFVPSEYVIPKYLYYLVQTEHFLRVANISSGTKMPRAEWANIEKEPFDIPCILIQEKTVSILEAIDKKICTSGDSLRMLMNFREGLLQQLFI